MRKLSLILAAFLTACGGGSPAPTPAPIPPATSTPTPTPTPVSVPFGQVFHGNQAGYRVGLGDLHWTAGGLTYAVLVQDYGFAAVVQVFSCSLPDCFGANQSWTFEAWLDDRLDIEGPKTADDAALRSYLSARLVPKLDAWLQGTSSRQKGMVIAPFNSSPVPAEWGPFDRLAARLPQWVIVTPNGAFLAP